LSSRGEFPIGNNLILVDLDPCENKFHFSRRKTTFQEIALGYCEYSFVVLVPGMNVRTVVAPVILKVQRHDYPEEH
jgi:hypothetical protein